MLAAFVTPVAVRIAGAVALIGFGLFKLVRPRSHPTYGGMRVGRRELIVWSFLMSSAHGAGLMLFPILVGVAPVAAATAHADPLHELTMAGLGGVSVGTGVLALTVHVAAMVLVMGAVALVVYQKVGLAVLRKAWVNLDMVWAVSLMAAGLFTLFTA